MLFLPCNFYINSQYSNGHWFLKAYGRSSWCLVYVIVGYRYKELHFRGTPILEFVNFTQGDHLCTNVPDIRSFVDIRAKIMHKRSLWVEHPSSNMGVPQKWSWYKVQFAIIDVQPKTPNFARNSDLTVFENRKTCYCRVYISTT